MTTLQEIADYVFKDDVMDIKEIEAKYPPRNVKEGQIVTRFAPSPTGFLHIGAIYTSMIATTLAKQSGGISYLRIEDTDQKRQVQDSVQLMIKGFEKFNISFDEGVDENLNDYGIYGPYIQSVRRTIYRSYAKKLLAEGKAYLCFCTEDDLEKMRHTQEVQKQRPGYYGRYAVCRNLTPEQVMANLEAGKPYVLRIRSTGDYKKRVKYIDVIRGERYLPENDIDPIIIKSSDGLPTYHFAHVVDDHLMGSTHIIRADEWLSSVPLHLELFELMGWEAPHYAHTAPMQKMEGETRRKLSKRKDAEADVAHFFEQGYPIESIIEYLMNIANSSFEDWRKQHPKDDISTFQLSIAKLPASGALFDLNKLDSISKNIISEYTNTQVYDLALAWAREYDKDFEQLLIDNEEYLKKIFNIERTTARKRKDTVKWSTLKSDIAFFFDSMFEKPTMESFNRDKALVIEYLADYIASLNFADDRETWWNKVKALAESKGFASDTKAYKAAPEKFKGNISDFMKVIRLAVTGHEDSPDIYEITHVLGFEKLKERLASYK